MSMLLSHHHNVESSLNTHLLIQQKRRNGYRRSGDSRRNDSKTQLTFEVFHYIPYINELLLPVVGEKWLEVQHAYVRGSQRGGSWTQDPALVTSSLPTKGKEEPVTCGGYSYAIALP